MIKGWHKYFSVTYMCIWPRAMTKTIVKINKTTTISNNFSNCCQVYFGVLLKNGKIGPMAYSVLFGKKDKNSLCPKNRSENFLAFVSTRARSGSWPNSTKCKSSLV